MIEQIIVTDDDEIIATQFRASPDKAEMVIRQSDESNDGRSKWSWFVLANGDVILGCFPMGDTFERISQSGELSD